MPEEPSMFIVSSGRSGTTLLISILNASEQVCIPYESDFIARAYPHYHKKTHFHEKDYLNLAHIFYETSQPKGWGLSEEQYYKFLLCRQPQTFADVHATLCRCYHEKEGTQNLKWGIKAPVLIASLERIKDVHPTAKIIHIVRDGRDVFQSYKKVHQKSIVKFGPKGPFSNALYWVDGLRRLREFGGTIYEFRYEDLLSQPEEETKKLFDFLNIQYSADSHQNFQSFSRNQTLVANDLMKDIHAKTSSGIDSSNVKKYLKDLSKFEIFIFELFAIPYLTAHGYEPEFSYLRLPIFTPIRLLSYFLARKLNDYRYHRRDLKQCSIALQDG